MMTEDAPNRASVLLVLLSDGAPSDGTSRECPCGIPIFQVDKTQDPLLGHKSKAAAWKCRGAVAQAVKSDCLERIRAVGRVFGRDKAVVATVAFGPPNEDFKVLQEMADVLPRGSFHKLGLNASGLKTAFSSLSSSMTELRTEGGGRGLTARTDRVVNKLQRVAHTDIITGSAGWWIYSHQELQGKYRWDLAAEKLVLDKLMAGATGLGFYQEPFASGVERLVTRCTEIEVPRDKLDLWYKNPWAARNRAGMMARRRGLRLVCKEAKDVQNWEAGLEFHQTFARIQTDAAVLAEKFNRRVRGPNHWQLSFLPVSIYLCADETYPNSEAWVLVEPELEGKFTKWNNVLLSVG